MQEALIHPVDKQCIVVDKVDVSRTVCGAPRVEKHQNKCIPPSDRQTCTGNDIESQLELGISYLSTRPVVVLLCTVASIR